MLLTIFNYVCGQIECLVQDQVAEVESNGGSVRAVLLVGGFGSSKFLHDRLEQSYKSVNTSIIQVEGA